MTDRRAPITVLVRAPRGVIGRAIGLMGRRTIPVPIILEPCKAVHGVGIVRPLDVAFYKRLPGGHGVSILSVSQLAPFGLRANRHADGAIEAGKGDLDYLRPAVGAEPVTVKEIHDRIRYQAAKSS